jgi:hypothetical protein
MKHIVARMIVGNPVKFMYDIIDINSQDYFVDMMTSYEKFVQGIRDQALLLGIPFTEPSQLKAYDEEQLHYEH